MVMLSALGLREIRYKNIQSLVFDEFERSKKQGKCLELQKVALRTCSTYLKKGGYDKIKLLI